MKNYFESHNDTDQIYLDYDLNIIEMIKSFLMHHSNREYESEINHLSKNLSKYISDWDILFLKRIKNLNKKYEKEALSLMMNLSDKLGIIRLKDICSLELARLLTINMKNVKESKLKYLKTDFLKL